MAFRDMSTPLKRVRGLGAGKRSAGELLSPV